MSGIVLLKDIRKLAANAITQLRRLYESPHGKSQLESNSPQRCWGWSCWGQEGSLKLSDLRKPLTEDTCVTYE